MHKYMPINTQAQLLAALYEWYRREPGRNRDIRLLMLDLLDPSDDVIDMAKQIDRAKQIGMVQR